MRRRRLLGLLATSPLWAPRVADARPMPPPDTSPPRPPISADNPRIWPAAKRDGRLPLGAVDAFAAPDKAAEVGISWQRAMFDWSAIQRHGPDEWSFGAVDLDVARRERDAGRPMIGLFMSAPAWASGTTDPKSPPLGLDRPDDDPANLWAAWVGTVVKRYAGSIDTWVMWNEPDVWSDSNHARQWAGTPEQYYRLLKVGYRAAKRANPESTVLMAGMTYWWDVAYGRELYFNRLLRLASVDSDWHFDGAVLQLYNNPRGLFDAPRIFRDLMRTWGVNRPVWINETNVVPWDDPVAPLTRAHFRATLDEQASYFIQAIAYALAAGASRVAVFKMMDDFNIRKGVEQAFGLIRTDESTRPAFDAYRLAIDQLAPTSRAQLVDEGPINRVHLEQPSLGRRLTVLWNTSPEALEAAVPAIGDAATLMDKFGNTSPLRVDPDQRLRISLAGATANTIPGYPDAYFIGGNPALVIEPLSDDYQPFEPTYENLPEPGDA